MLTDEQWKAADPEAKRDEILARAPSVSEANVRLVVEERPGKVARFTITRYTEGRHGGGGETA